MSNWVLRRPEASTVLTAPVIVWLTWWPTIIPRQCNTNHIIRYPQHQQFRTPMLLAICTRVVFNNTAFFHCQLNTCTTISRIMKTGAWKEVCPNSPESSDKEKKPPLIYHSSFGSKISSALGGCAPLGFQKRVGVSVLVYSLHSLEE